MKFRRSRVLNLELQENNIYIQNIIFNKAKFAISPAELSYISTLADFTQDESAVLSFFLSEYDEEFALDRLKLFISQYILLTDEMTKINNEENYFVEKWQWGIKGAAFHFEIKNARFYSPTSEIPSENEPYILLQTKNEKNPSPALYDLNASYDVVYNFSKPTFNEESFFSFLHKRKSIRKFKKDLSLTKHELINCLYYSLGIKRLRDAPPLKNIPLKMTPSGGGRNPYEAYVFCQNIDDLTNGVYHYSAFENSLALVTSDNTYSASDILGNQKWVSDAAAIIILEANLERTMWKYNHSTSYRVALIEAGHIGQNILLAATVQGFDATPTAAIVNEYYDQIVGKSLSTKLPTYALVLGHAAEDADELKY